MLTSPVLSLSRATRRSRARRRRRPVRPACPQGSAAPAERSPGRPSRAAQRRAVGAVRPGERRGSEGRRHGQHRRQDRDRRVRRPMLVTRRRRAVSTTATAMSAPAVSHHVGHRQRVGQRRAASHDPERIAGACAAACPGQELGQAVGGDEQDAPDQGRCSRGQRHDSACAGVREPSFRKGEEHVDGDDEQRPARDVAERVEARRRRCRASSPSRAAG